MGNGDERDTEKTQDQLITRHIPVVLLLHHGSFEWEKVVPASHLLHLSLHHWYHPPLPLFSVMNNGRID